jgi:hypothetical protein
VYGVALLNSTNALDPRSLSPVQNAPAAMQARLRVRIVVNAVATEEFAESGVFLGKE